MIPSNVKNDLSLLLRMDCSARRTASARGMAGI
jgi:hypothetical protein